MGYSSIEEAQERARQLDAQLGKTPPRRFAAIRGTENPHNSHSLKRSLEWYGYKNIEEVREHLADLEARMQNKPC